MVLYSQCVVNGFQLKLANGEPTREGSRGGRGKSWFHAVEVNFSFLFSLCVTENSGVMSDFEEVHPSVKIVLIVNCLV